jgi:hypothetical protein
MRATHKNLDIRHGSVNHKIEFMNSDGQQVHTQTIKRLWLSFRALVLKTISKIMGNSYFALFLYFVKHECSIRHPDDRFRLFCQHLGRVYGNRCPIRAGTFDDIFL